MERPALQPLPIKLYRAGDLVTVAAPMPGLAADEISAEVTSNGRLVVEGHVADVPESEALKSPSKDVLLDEWAPGPVPPRRPPARRRRRGGRDAQPRRGAER